MATSTMTMAKALNEGLRRAMEANPKVLLMGEDIGKLGGVFRVTDGLQKDFGQDRVIDTPLAESAIVGTAVGLAIRGYRTVCEMQFDGFVFPAFDQIVSQVAKLHKRSDGIYTMGLVIRLPFQGGIGAIEHHSESPEAYFAHTPGLRVVSCSTPNDAYWMIQQAIESDDPIIFCEPKSRYWEKGEVDLENPPQGPTSPSSAMARASRPCCAPPTPPTRRAPRSRSSICAALRRLTFPRWWRRLRRRAAWSSSRRHRAPRR